MFEYTRITPTPACSQNRDSVVGEADKAKGVVRPGCVTSMRPSSLPGCRRTGNEVQKPRKVFCGAQC